jgi:alkylmercury lyase
MADAGGSAVELRPGVFRPDWAAAKSAAARRALGKRADAREGLLDKWAHAHDPETDRVWRVMLQLYGSTGLPPSPGEVAAQAEVPEPVVQGALLVLQGHDLLKLRSDGTILYAYPFTQEYSGHTIVLGNHELESLCAIDALGTGAMFGADVKVHSSCPVCGGSVDVSTNDRGTSISEVSPADAVVWYECSYGESAASSCCPSIAFFCSQDHLQVWKAQNPDANGMQLTINEALEVGRAIFGPVLRTSSSG